MSEPSPEQASVPRPGSIIAGKYRVDAVLGEGGMGVVFAATHVLTGRSTALKWMRAQLADDPRALQRFLREARAAGRIDHPNVIAIHDVDFADGCAFMVMERLRGEPLSALLKREGRLPVADALSILTAALAGVAAAHARGVVHRDLKPENIFLCRTPGGSLQNVKVLDFGISKLLIEDPFPQLTNSGSLIGTPYYMSPEQVRGRRDLDTRADVYAMGVILYEALTGELPFRGKTLGALALEITRGTPRPPRALRPDLPPAIERVILQAMAPERSQRFPDASGLRAALLAASQQSPDPAAERAEASSATVAGGESPGRRRGWLAASAAFAAAGVLAAAWVKDCSARERARPGWVIAPPAATATVPAQAGSASASPAALGSHAEGGSAGAGPASAATPRELATPPETPRRDPRPAAKRSHLRASVERARPGAREPAPTVPPAPAAPSARSRTKAKIAIEDF